LGNPSGQNQYSLWLHMMAILVI